MRNRAKFSIAGLIAALLLSLAVASAPGGRLSFSHQRFTVIWSELTVSAAVGTIICPVTIEGSYHSSIISKVVGALIGYVSRASVVPASCREREGTLTINQEALPWHVRYRGFTGTLPNITGIQLGLVRAKFTLNREGIGCITASTATSPIVGTAETSGLQILNLRLDERAEIPLMSEEFTCRFIGNSRFSGRGRTTILGTSARMSVTLI